MIVIVQMILLGVFLIVAGYMDIKYKKISVLWCVFFMIMGLAISMGSSQILIEGVGPIILSVMPGGILLIISKMTNQSIGIGDGVVAIVVGMLLGIEKTVMALLGGFMISGVVSIILLMFRKAEKGYELPFVPMLSVAVLLVVWESK